MKIKTENWNTKVKRFFKKNCWISKALVCSKKNQGQIPVTNVIKIDGIIYTPYVSFVTLESVNMYDFWCNTNHILVNKLCGNSKF